jgi:hypothetical protein
MAYSNVGIANMALQRIGAKSSISALTDATPNAEKVNTVWEYILNECLETIKPHFATVRVALAQSTTSPANTDQYEYCYSMPSDYLCLAEGTADDPSVWPKDCYPYSIESLDGWTFVLMTNYDTSESDEPIYVTYVRKATNPAKYTALFINAFAYRLAAELSYTITEGAGTFEHMMNMYDKFRIKAGAVDKKQNYIEDEKSNTDWEMAGR